MVIFETTASGDTAQSRETIGSRAEASFFLQRAYWFSSRDKNAVVRPTKRCDAAF